MAAAWAYHIAGAQTFLDGNKRTTIAGERLDKEGLSRLFRGLFQTLWICLPNNFSLLGFQRFSIFSLVCIPVDPARGGHDTAKCDEEPDRAHQK